MYATASRQPSFLYGAQLVLLAFLICVTGNLGLAITPVDGLITLVWLPSGIALGALLIFGIRLWPGVVLGLLLGALAAPSWAALPLPTVLVIVLGNTLEAAAGAMLLKRYFAFSLQLESVEDVLALSAVGVIAAPILGALIGTIALALGSAITWNELPRLAFLWWIGDAMGILLIVPALLTWATIRQRWQGKLLFEAAVMTALLVILNIAIFQKWFGSASPLLAYLTFAFLMWAALRFGQRETATLSFLTAVIAIWSTMQGYRLFAADSAQSNILYTWIYLAAVAISGLLLAAITTERRKAQRALQQERDFAAQIMNTMAQGIIVTEFEPYNRFTYVNPAFARMVGYPREAMLESETEPFIEQRDHAQVRLAREERAAGTSSAYEISLKHADSQLIPVLINGAPYWKNGQIIGSIASVTDLTRFKEVEAALREGEADALRLQEQLRVLHQVTIELSQCTEFDDLCRRAVELGRQRLGFERLSLWFLDEDPRFMVGTFGTDELGNLRDERSQRITAENPSMVSEVLGLRKPVGYEENATLYNDRHEAVGVGWIAMGSLWDGDRVIGGICTDNYLTRRALGKYELDLLSLYGASLGHLVKRIRTEEALRKAEARFARAFHANPSALAIATFHQLRYIDVNEAFCRLLGYAREEVIGRTALEIGTVTESVDDRRRMTHVLREKGTLGYFETHLRAKSGELRQVLASMEVIELDGEPHLLAMAQDVTELRRAEAAEHEQRRLAEALRDSAAALNSSLELDEVLDRILTQVANVVPYDAATIMQIDENGLIRLLRDRGREEFRVKREHAADIVVHIADAPIVARMVQTHLPTAIADVSQHPDWRNIIFKNRWIGSYVGALMVFQGQSLGLINLYSAETGTFNTEHARRLQAFANQAAIALQNARRASDLERRVAQRTFELDVQRQQLQVILDSTGDGIYYTENDVIQYVNSAITEITGYNSAELIGRTTDIWRLQAPSHDEKDESARAQEVIAAGAVWREERRLRRKDGSAFDASLTVSLVGQPGDHPLRTVTILRDISREKELEAQKARFIANAAHELRSPVSGLNIRLNIMQRQPEKLHEHIQRLDEIVRRINRLVEDLLDVSRFQHGVIALRRQYLDLREVVHDTLTLHHLEAEMKNIHLFYQPVDSPIYVNADSSRLSQVITNLITNALYHTQSGGEVRVSCAIDDTRHMARIVVADNGSGIPQNDLPYIFQPFYRVDTTRAGTGLGLSISKEIVELHGGTISVESQLGYGTRFQIDLPLATAPARAASTNN